MPKTVSGCIRQAKNQSWPSRRRQGRGGGHEYPMDALPAAAEEALLKRAATQTPAEDSPSCSYDAQALWQWAQTRTQKLRDQGAARASLLEQAMRLHAGGERLGRAFGLVADANDVSAASLRNWFYGVNGRPGAKDYARQNWAAALIPGYAGRTALAEIPAPAWDWYRSYYLTRRQPTHAESYRRLCETARAQGWGMLPSGATFARRVKSEVSHAVMVLKRQGEQALMQMYPPQRRDKMVFAAGEAVVGDGLKFDRLWVRWPDGEIINTSTGWFWADIRTNYIAAYRLAKTENTDLLRLATYDLTGKYKPDLAWLDNTMAAANKPMTGGARHRRRHRARPDDPVGLLEQLHISVRFTNPDRIFGNPGAKPIERSFGSGGLHDKVASHPKFIDRGYSKATAIPYEEFAAVVAEEVNRFNAQPGRRTPACRGSLSFEQAFEEGVKDRPLTRLTEAQRALLLLMPEVVRVHRKRGEIALAAGRGPMGRHRYYADALNAWQGQQVVAWYDPEALTRAVTVQSLDGRQICRAEHQGDVAFQDTAAAREHAKNKQRYRKAHKQAAVAQVRMSELELAAQYPAGRAGPVPEHAVVGGNFGQKMKADIETGEVVSDEGINKYEQSFVRLMPHMQEVIKRRGEKL